LQAQTALVSVGPETTACPESGSMTISANIANPETLSPNDSFSLTYNDCNLGDGVVADGAIAFTVTSFQGDLGGDQFSLGFSLTVNNLTLADPAETVSVDGDFALAMNTSGTSTSVTVSGSSLSMTNGTETFSLSQFSTTATVDLSIFPESFTVESQGYLMSSDFDGEVRFNTSIAFSGNGEGNPVSGELLITGANQATIKVIPLDGNNVRLELDIDGDNAVDQDGVIELTWQELQNVAI